MVEGEREEVVENNSVSVVCLPPPKLPVLSPEEPEEEEDLDLFEDAAITATPTATTTHSKGGAGNAEENLKGKEKGQNLQN